MHLFGDKDGKLWKRLPGSDQREEVALPTGVAQRAPFQRPDPVLFPELDCALIVGQFSPNLIWLPSLQELHILGISKPTAAPSLATGGGTGITGEVSIVFTFAHIDETGRIRHESNPSPPSGTVTFTNDSADVTGLPTSHPNPRVNALRFYVSVDGDDYLFEGNMVLGSSTYSFATPAEELANEAVSNRRGVPPIDAVGLGNARGRAWYFLKSSARIVFSEINEPESVASTNYLLTRDRRLVTALKMSDEQILVGTRKSIQEIQGWGNEDFEVRFITRAFGIVSHHGSYVLNGKFWAMTAEGFVQISGSDYRFLMPTLRSYFRDAYLANPAEYEDAIAEIDPYLHVLRVLIPLPSAFYYIGYYLPSEVGLGGTGTLPDWTFDRRGRKDYTMGLLSTNSYKTEAFTGSCDGQVRSENVAADADDDGDSYAKAMTIAFSHNFAGDQSGADDHCKTVEDLDVFAKSELTPFRVSLFTGDDDAYRAATAAWWKDVAASRKVKNGKTAIAKTSHKFKNVGAAGKGQTLEITATAPVEFEHRGFAWAFKDGGEQNRPEAE